MNTNFNTFFQKVMPFFFVILFAYILSSISSLFLPKSGIDFKESSKNSLAYQKYSGFYSKMKVKDKKEKKPVKKDNIQTLSKYQLKAIYSTQSNSGWIIVQAKNSKDSIILAKDEKLDGYILTKLYKNFVIFENNSKEFKLELPKEKDINYKVEKNESNKKEVITVNEDNVSVKRDYLNTYVNDLDKVWKDISIKDIRKDGSIEGFKVFKVNKNSVFGKLGLKQNDIIKSVNGTRIKSYADAFKIYNEINKLDYLTLEILRNNDIMELNYEID